MRSRILSGIDSRRMKTDIAKVSAIVLVILLSGLAGVSIYVDLKFKSFPEFPVQNGGRGFSVSSNVPLS